MFKGVCFSRWLKQTKDFSAALADGHAFDASDSEAEERDASLDPGRSSLDRAKARAEVVSILLERRRFHADRVHDAIDAITLYTDASPTTGLEFQGMVADVFRKNGQLERITLPGSTLCYGMQDAVAKSMALVWSIWLVTGPILADVAYFCDSVVGITTDSGTEQATLTMPNVLEALNQWVRGTPLDQCRQYVQHGERL